MKITESRLRQIIRETYAQMAAAPALEPWQKITDADVDSVLKTLIRGGGFDDADAVKNLLNWRVELPRRGEHADPHAILGGIMGWILSMDYDSYPSAAAIRAGKAAMAEMNAISKRTGYEIESGGDAIQDLLDASATGFVLP